ncbi:MAG TPA: CBS domain-containing protein [Gemmataceae bacterium]|jgi:CBS domain-containing protein|nr:CBS domain-containing protein [Gemmataceae bacterium]
MKKTPAAKPPASLDLLDSLTAADLMTPHPVSIHGQASVDEATVLFTDRAFTGAAVIDENGRPIGVLTSSDILIHDREKSNCVTICTRDYSQQEFSAQAERNRLKSGYQVVNVDRTTVSSVMTPVIFSVAPESSLRKVMHELVSLQIHRVFVVDNDGVLVGVISANDVLKGILQAATGP